MNKSEELLKRYIIKELYNLRELDALSEQEDLNEVNIKKIAGLGLLGLLGFFAKGNITSNNVVQQTERAGITVPKDVQQVIDKKFKEGQSLAKKMTAKQFEDTRNQLLDSERKYLAGDLTGEEIFKTLLKKFILKSKSQNYKNSLDRKNEIPIASIEKLGKDIFVFTAEELNEYFNNEKNRSILELNDGSNILDMSKEELNYQMSDQTSEVVKLIAEELITSSIIESDVLDQKIDAFGSIYDNEEREAAIAEIQNSHKDDLLRSNALKSWLKRNITAEGQQTLDDIIKFTKSNKKNYKEWIKRYNSGEMPDDRTGTFDSDESENRNSKTRDISGVIDFIDK